MGRALFYFVGSGFLLFGLIIFLFTLFSCKIEINYPAFIASAFGFGMLGIGSIIILLTDILDQLKKD